MKAGFISKISLTTLILLFTILTGCAKQSSRPQEPEEDIYAALRNDGDISQRQRRGDDEANRNGQMSEAAVNDRIEEVRNLYFDQAYDDAKALSERILRVAPSAAENYYWLARIKLAQGESQQAYDIATKGMELAQQSGLKREMKRIQRQAEVGAF